METSSNAVSTPAPAVRQGRSGARIVLIIFGVLLLGAGLAAATTVWWVSRNLYAGHMQPVSMSAAEQQTLQEKLRVLEQPATPTPAVPGEAERTLLITAREINGYLAAQNLGETIHVDLGNGTVAATMIVPMPADTPLLGGKTLRVKVALAATMSPDKKLNIMVTNVSLGGLPVPNAWLNDIKGVNLVGENLEKDPGLQRFFAGIQALEIKPEGLRVVLNE